MGTGVAILPVVFISASLLVKVATTASANMSCTGDDVHSIVTMACRETWRTGRFICFYAFDGDVDDNDDDENNDDDEDNDYKEDNDKDEDNDSDEDKQQYDDEDDDEGEKTTTVTMNFCKFVSPLLVKKILSYKAANRI